MAYYIQHQFKWRFLCVFHSLKGNESDCRIDVAMWKKARKILIGFLFKGNKLYFEFQMDVSFIAIHLLMFFSQLCWGPVRALLYTTSFLHLAHNRTIEQAAALSITLLPFVYLVGRLCWKDETREKIQRRFLFWMDDDPKQACSVKRRIECTAPCTLHTQYIVFSTTIPFCCNIIIFKPHFSKPWRNTLRSFLVICIYAGIVCSVCLVEICGLPEWVSEYALYRFTFRLNCIQNFKMKNTNKN